MIKILTDFITRDLQTGKYYEFKRGEKYSVYSFNEEVVRIDLDKYDEPDWGLPDEDVEENEYLLEGIFELPMNMENEMFEFIDEYWLNLLVPDWIINCKP